MFYLLESVRLYPFRAICNVCSSPQGHNWTDLGCTQFPRNDRDNNNRQEVVNGPAVPNRPASSQPSKSYSSPARPMVEPALMMTVETLLTPGETTPTRTANTSADSTLSVALPFRTLATTVRYSNCDLCKRSIKKVTHGRSSTAARERGSGKT